MIHTNKQKHDVFSPNQLPQVIEKIRANDPKLLVLKISIYLDTQNLQDLADALLANTTLRSLNLLRDSSLQSTAKYPLATEGAQALAKVIEQNKTLQKINLFYVLDSPNMQILATAITKNSTLQELLLNSSINDASAIVLAAAITNHPSLQLVNLSVNNIGDIGAQSLAQVISPKLQVYLSWNQIGIKGATALIDALKTQRTLNLSGNALGDDGAQAVANLIADSTFIKEVYLIKQERHALITDFAHIHDVQNQNRFA